MREHKMYDEARPETLVKGRSMTPNTVILTKLDRSYANFKERPKMKKDEVIQIAWEQFSKISRRNRKFHNEERFIERMRSEYGMASGMLRVTCRAVEQLFDIYEARQG